ncbi:MAG: carboxylate--amine ligase [Candidatus Lambdaproteobacteria bacterium RIFOXYD1_FULL_56_27]|uniref:Carboxylate--amine ligase n=1 Tax=Candidatus Lambdaproteobacteria bacterium RIFOXYD2_FULL_56_26 TaxID=1817773 RepID=A0A1F6GR81_9PROT|nr:MAG: carboxylate--amine ligase [Candidatus Lambdaproteobacteria bacterium RIFOXYC1_FULL_56_13]OGH00676.1 MAG: carboxylate--amine ligase [Candidatus Lambdaproteobacteria bacterium RIFOXYD2_FULL_56_26]OGH07843.1 MAG: carboxylate--amine ligase [Candidatus Lambdaproteobacteria bacterium RIFOXYD1_FULL_56_27]
MNPLVVALSGLNATDNPGPGVGVARSLREDKGLDPKMLGLVYDALEPGAHMEWLVDRAYMMPYPLAGKSAFLERISQLVAQEGLNFAIPNLDLELPLYIRCAPELEALGVKTFLPDMAQFKLRGKEHLGQLAEELGLHMPQTKVVNNLEELKEACEEVGFPLLVKGAFYSAHLVHNPLAAVAAYHEVVTQWGYPVLVQARIEGEEINLVGVGDGKGGSLGQVSAKKLVVSSQNKIFAGVTIRHEALAKAAERFLARYQWRGAFELECILKDEEIHMIEINPRFPAWVYFATAVGVNLPAQLVKAGLGLEIEPVKDYEAGKLFLRYTYEMITDMTHFKNLTLHGHT